MSGVALVLSFDGLGVARAALGALQAAGEDLRPVLKDIGATLEASTVRRFETNIAPDGTPWLPSAAALREGRHTLEKQGHLRDSIHSFVDGDSAVEVATAMEYAAVHQVGFDGEVEVSAHERRFAMAFGRPIKPRKVTVKAHQRRMTMPARPYLGISADDEVEIGEIVLDAYRAALGRRLG